MVRGEKWTQPSFVFLIDIYAYTRKKTIRWDTLCSIVVILLLWTLFEQVTPKISIGIYVFFLQKIKNLQNTTKWFFSSRLMNVLMWLLFSFWSCMLCFSCEDNRNLYAFYSLFSLLFFFAQEDVLCQYRNPIFHTERETTWRSERKKNCFNCCVVHNLLCLFNCFLQKFQKIKIKNLYTHKQ